ncbi:MAG: DUF190 domain-containing protein [Chloroflexota bacterium]
MNLFGGGKRVRIYISEQDKAGRQPLWEALLGLLRDNGAAGATIFRAQAGFGAHSRIRIARLADIVPDLPVVVEWIDDPARVERLLPRVSALVEHGAITIEDVELLKYSPRLAEPNESEGEDSPT